MSIGVIIPAAGKSKRFNGVYKPLLKINGKTILGIILDKFARLPDVEKIVIAVNKQYINQIEKVVSSQSKIHGSKFKIILGGMERKYSVFYAFEELRKYNHVDTIIIHDAARPIIDLKLLYVLLSKIKRYNAVVPVKPVAETVKFVNEGYIKNTVDRTKLFLSLTPQVFKKNILEYAYTTINLREHTITDEAQLLEILNKKVKIVKYQGYNVKITYPEDYCLVKLLLKYTEHSSPDF